MAKHARFDEGMNDLPFEDIPPNVQHLVRSRHGEPLPVEDDEATVNEFEFKLNPFDETITKTLKVTSRDSSFGLELATDPLYNRAYVVDVKNRSSAQRMFSTIKAARNKIKGAFIVSIDGEQVFTVHRRQTGIHGRRR